MPLYLLLPFAFQFFVEVLYQIHSFPHLFDPAAPVSENNLYNKGSSVVLLIAHYFSTT